MSALDKSRAVGSLYKSRAVGVLGAGTMGAGIAQVAAEYGHPVKLHDCSAAAIDNSLQAIRAALDRRVRRGRMEAGDAEQLVARIEPCPEPAQLAGCGLIIEAVAEDLQVKRALLKQIEAICAPETVLATNTSSLSVTEIGAALGLPHKLVGMHFFNPAPVMRLVEVVSGAATTPPVVRRAFDTAVVWGKIPVSVRDSPGFIVNRVTRALYAEPLRLLQEGAAGIHTLDALFKESAGFPLGPFELMDVIGNDVNYAVTESMFEAYYRDSRFQPSLRQKKLVAAGLLGRKSGRGWHDYTTAPVGAPVALQPETAHSDFRPRAVRVCGDLGVASALLRLAKRSGIEVVRNDREPGESGADGIHIDGTFLTLTDGRSATVRAREDGCRDLVLFDLMAGYAAGRRIALAGARQANPRALQHAIGFFNALGKAVSVLNDAPGLCVMRTVCMLANEGADAVHHGVCSVDSVDRAMIHGMNYPHGPLRWADRIGLARVQRVLRNLQRSYGLERYRCSQLIERMAAAGETFYKQPAGDDHE